MPDIEKLIQKQKFKGLIKVLKKSTSSRERERAEKALKNIGKPAVEPLIKELKDKDRNVRSCAVTVLGNIGDPRAVEPLIQALQDKDSDVQRNAREALEKIGKLAVEPLIQALKHENSKVIRWSAAWALGYIGDPRAIEPLIQALEDEDVRVAAAGALVEIGDTRAVNPLLKVVRDNSIDMDSRVRIVEGARHLSGDWPNIKIDRSNHRDHTVHAHGICSGHHTDEGTRRYLLF